MIRHQLHTRFAPLRISIIAVWVISLVTAGISPSYYISSSLSSSPDNPASQVANHSSSVAGESYLHEKSDTEYDEDFTDTRRVTKNTVALRWSHNPFKIESLNQTSSSGEVDPLESDRSMSHKAPLGSPVVLWLVNAGTSGTIGSSNLTRHYQQSGVADIQARRQTTSVITASSICSEHPSKRFAATLLGQKPSGVS